MKRAMDGPAGNFKRARSQPIGPEIRFLIPSKVAGAIIGKGGENVKRLRNDFNADVSIPDSNTPERILHVATPDVQGIFDITLELIAKIEENYHVGSKDPEIKVIVHQSQAGAIIGRSGLKIKELRESTGTAIKVFGECCPHSSDRLVVIGGQNSKILNALREVMKILDDVPIKGPARNYDTNNYDPAFVEDYGGYGVDRHGGGGGGRGRGVGGGGRGVGGGGRGVGGGRRGGGAPGGSTRGGGPPMYGSGGGFGGDRGRDPYYGQYKEEYHEEYAGYGGAAVHGPPMNMEDYDGPMSQQQVTIPKDLAGSIIGKGGDRINRIRQDSGAKITLHESDPNSTERIITIEGAVGSIKQAQRMLQECVRASAAGRRYIYEANR